MTICDEKDQYRFGFNGMEKDNEAKGLGNSLDFGARIYDSRLGRFLSLDPDRVKYPNQSPFIVSDNSPIYGIDEEGKGWGYATLKFLAQQSKSTVGVTVSGGVQLGVATSAAAGIAVDPRGNAALFFSVTAGRDNNMTPNSFRNLAIAPSAQATANISFAPNKLVTSVSGRGASLLATFGANGLVASGSVNYNVSPDGRAKEFNSLSLGVGVGTPGIGIGLNSSSTYAVLLSGNDYNLLADTPWDAMGRDDALSWNRAINGDNSSSPIGFWNYDGTTMDFEPVEGTKNEFEIVMTQKFHFNKAGTNQYNSKDVQVTKKNNTGIVIKKSNQYTYTSSNLEE